MYYCGFLEFLTVNEHCGGQTIGLAHHLPIHMQIHIQLHRWDGGTTSIQELSDYYLQSDIQDDWHLKCHWGTMSIGLPKDFGNQFSGKGVNWPMWEFTNEDICERF